jgi:hypothetical protein
MCQQQQMLIESGVAIKGEFLLSFQLFSVTQTESD